jgi:hypothetical protein
MHLLTPRSAAGASLLLGVAAFSTGDLLRRSVEPAVASTASLTAAVSDHSGTWLAAGMLELLSAFLLVGALGAARLVRQRGVVLTRIGAWLLAAGAIASTGHTIGYFGTYAAYADSGLDADALSSLAKSPDVLGGTVIAVFMLGLLLGPVLLTIGLRRAALVPIWVPVVAVVFVVAGAVSGLAAGVVGLIAGLASLGYVGVAVLRTAPDALLQRPGVMPAV